jgi:hypothetical protein
VLLGKSQPTVSRLLAGLGDRGVLHLGGGRGARYGLRKPLLGAVPGEQPIWRHESNGQVERWGTLRWLAANHIHVAGAAGGESLVKATLPWFLAAYKPEPARDDFGLTPRNLSRPVAFDSATWGGPANWPPGCGTNSPRMRRAVRGFARSQRATRSASTTSRAEPLFHREIAREADLFEAGPPVRQPVSTNGPLGVRMRSLK